MNSLRLLPRHARIRGRFLRSLVPGTIALPYCSIAAAAAAHPEPGAHFVVLAGTYREQILVPASGVAGDPIVFEAADPSVTIDGTND